MLRFVKLGLLNLVGSDELGRDLLVDLLVLI